MQLDDETKVEAAIDGILDDLTSHEVARRVKNTIGARVFRLSDPIETAQEQAENFAATLRDELSAEKIGAIRQESEQRVQDITDGKKRREFFNGKRILEEFYRRHMQESGMSKEIFLYECARRASERSSVKKFVQELMSSLGLEPVVAPQHEPDD